MEWAGNIYGAHNLGFGKNKANKLLIFSNLGFEQAKVVSQKALSQLLGQHWLMQLLFT